MSQTYFGSTLRSGSGSLTDTTDGGYVVLAQTVTVTTVAAGTAVNGTITLPAGSQIIEMFADKIVAPVVGGGTATTYNAAVGSTSSGTEYMPATNMASIARTSGTLVVADVAAMANINSNTTVYCSISPNGTISTTQGQYLFTIVYAQKV
jgi:hypothetical protein